MVSQSRDALLKVCGRDSVVPELLLSAREVILEGTRAELLGARIDPGDPKLLKYLMMSMGALPDETLRILFLDSASRLIADEQLQGGTLGQLAFYPRPIIRRAIEQNAAGIVLVHNHPSGDPVPSEDDIAATRALVEIARPLDIEIIDHIVVTSSQSRRIFQTVSKTDSKRRSNAHRLKEGAASHVNRVDIADRKILENAKLTVRRRILRRQLMGSPDLFGEPAWDMLIDLFIHECEGRSISASSLCTTTALSVSSAGRVLHKLCDAEIAYRTGDPNDGRRQFVRLAPDIFHIVRAYFAEGAEG